MNKVVLGTELRRTVKVRRKYSPITSNRHDYIISIYVFKGSSYNEAPNFSIIKVSLQWIPRTSIGSGRLLSEPELASWPVNTQSLALQQFAVHYEVLGSACPHPDVLSCVSIASGGSRLPIED